jgi:hypothetical protein
VGDKQSIDDNTRELGLGLGYVKIRFMVRFIKRACNSPASNLPCVVAGQCLELSLSANQLPSKGVELGSKLGLLLGLRLGLRLG